MRGLPAEGSAVLLGAALLLVACAAPGAVQLSCLPLASYSAAEQQALSEAISSLPSDSPILRALLDYEALRDADRACQRGRSQ